MEILIRPLCAGDVPAAAAIEAAVPDGWSENGVRGALESDAARCFFALAGGEGAGFAAFTCAGGEANLDALSVAPAWRRRGVARALLTHALAQLAGEGAGEAFLEVRASNAPAQALYRSLGFIQIGIRKGFYTKPREDAVLMRKELCRG